MDAVVNRLTHWKTTAAGVGIGGAVYYVLTSWHCQLPSDWLAWGLTAAPAVLGMLSKDA